MTSVGTKIHSKHTMFSVVPDMLTHWNKNVTLVLPSTTVLWKWTLRQKQYYSDEYPFERHLHFHSVFISIANLKIQTLYQADKRQGK